MPDNPRVGDLMPARPNVDPRLLRLSVTLGYLSAAVITALATVTPDPDRQDHPALRVIAGVALLLGVVLALGRRLPFPVLRLLSISGAIVLTSCTLSVADPVGPTLLFYMWPAFTTGYYCGRWERLANYALLFAGLLVALHLSPAGEQALPLLSLVSTVTVFVIVAGFTHHQVERESRLVAALQRSASTDPLTGLLNRRAWTAAFERELDRARRAAVPLSIVMFDLDHFKRINDDHGHAAGDEALRQFAAILTEHTTTADLVARTGGEEFTVALFGRGSAGAAAFAEGIGTALIAARRAAGDPALTASAGVATVTPELATIDALLIEADRALYAAKRAGRNRVVTAPAGPFPAPADPSGPVTPVPAPADGTRPAPGPG